MFFFKGFYTDYEGPVTTLLCVWTGTSVCALTCIMPKYTKPYQPSVSLQ